MTANSSVLVYAVNLMLPLSSLARIMGRLRCFRFCDRVQISISVTQVPGSWLLGSAHCCVARSRSKTSGKETARSIHGTFRDGKTENKSTDDWLLALGLTDVPRRERWSPPRGGSGCWSIEGAQQPVQGIEFLPGWEEEPPKYDVGGDLQLILIRPGGT